MGLMEARDAIAAKTAINVPAFKASTVHGGQFSLEDLRQEVTRSPCAITSCIGINGSEIGGNQAIIDANWAMVIVAKDALPVPRSSMCLMFANEVLKFLPLENWDYEGFFSLPTDIRGRSLDSNATERQMASMFLITWRQKIYAGDMTNPDSLEDWLSTNIHYFLQDPEDLTQDAEDLIEYT